MNNTVRFSNFILLFFLGFVMSNSQTKTIKGQITEYNIPVVKTYQIKGVVTDSSGAPLSGAQLMVKHGVVSASSDGQGRFTMTVSPDDKTLVCYSPGMKFTETPISPILTTINVRMFPDSQNHSITRQQSGSTRITIVRKRIATR
jgi:hypothetical protein